MQRFLERIVEHLERVQRVGHEVAKAGLVPDLARYQAFVVTGYASPESIERAFAAGVYDYLEKTPSFTTLLRVKVGNIMELQRQRWLAYVGVDADRAQARELWSRVKAETHSQRKGRLLEDLLELLLKSVPGFVVKTNRRGLDEELDLVVRIEEADSFGVLRKGPSLVVPIDQDDLERLVEAADRSSVLKDFHQRTVELTASK